MKRSAGRAALILAIAAVFVFAAALAAGWGSRPQPIVLDHYDVIVENQDPAPVEIQLRQWDGGFQGFIVPAGSWAEVPGDWTTIYTVDESCGPLSEASVRWGKRSTRVFTIHTGDVLDYYYGDYAPLPTVGRLAAVAPSQQCPDGPRTH